MVMQNAILPMRRHASRYEAAAQTAASVVWDVLQNFRGTSAELISSLKLTEENDEAWLFVVLDDIRIPNYQPYVTALHALSTSLRGRKVYISNSSGFRYGVLLSDRPAMPKEILFPGIQNDVVRIGIRTNGRPLTLAWRDLGHVLTASMTRYGKSNFLRLLAIQARAAGFRFLLADLDGRTFTQLKGDPSLVLPIANTREGFDQVVDATLAELSRRVRLFEGMEESPDNLDEYNAKASEPLAPIMLMLDEFSSVVLGMGGAKSEFAKRATEIAWRGLKFGIHVVLAGQDFSKDIVGPIREQMRTRICFRVATPDISDIVIGRRGAENIRVPGRGVMPIGKVQTYLVAKDALGNGDTAQGPRVSEAEAARISQVAERFGGRAELEGIQEVYRMNERAARRVRDDWAARGLIEKRASANNAWFFVQTPWASKPVQTVSERPNGVQTALDGQI